MQDQAGISYIITMSRFFNTCGPVDPADHYTLDPLQRVDINSLFDLVRHKGYFVLHAPRQTGKTSSLLALRDYLNTGSEFACVYVNVEAAQAVRNNVAAGSRNIRAD
ncbi:MAG: hypothetical protein GF398_10720 [Chitinivibrionales bacterium]|nr:hypothetical protein [Chitinivibrionales bacterium]